MRRQRLQHRDMTPTFASQLDALSAWRSAIDSQLGQLGRFAREHELLDDDASAWFEAMRVRLAGDKLIVAFVAEFSRGKSELINAVFFAGSGRRMLPATPGRTTMCPVELGYDADEPTGLSLLPIETRLDNVSLTELYGQPKAWHRIEIDLQQPDQMAQALTEVMRTRAVTVDDARALGFWDDDRPDDNPKPDAEGKIDVPVWRHARINLPHPLLKRGLVVLDTPGLNAIGTEPELTLGLLPMAHATVFILGADTGVTKSDLSIWRDHLSGPALARFVALNKIDALADPLSPPAVTQQLIEQQCGSVARDLELPRDHVFPISARQALAARVEGNDAMLQSSRILALEQALSEGLLPKRRETLEGATIEGVRQLQSRVQRKLSDDRRQVAEQLLELRGLRGKSAGKVQLMLKRAQLEADEFEACTTKLSAMRSVHSRMLKDTLVGLSSDKLRDPVDRFQGALSGSLLQLGAKKAFAEMCTQLRRIIEVAQVRSSEIHAMLAPTFAQLNAEYGFSLSLETPPDLLRFANDLSTIERNYVQYLGLGQAIKLAQPRFQAQFRRMLVSRLRVVFESASGEIELWNKTASAQVDTQLRERRRTFKRRQESLERIQQAAGELESRLSELQAQDDRMQQVLTRLNALADGVIAQASQALPEPVAAAGAGEPLSQRIELGGAHLRLIEPSREPGLQAQA